MLKRWIYMQELWQPQPAKGESKVCDHEFRALAMLTWVTVNALLDSIEAWKLQLAALKREDRDCAAEKDKIKDTLEWQDYQDKVLKWIKREGAPDPRHSDMKKKTGMNQDAYQAAGQWFTDMQWFERFMTPRAVQSPGTETHENVVWLRGISKTAVFSFATVSNTFAVGNGKSTLM